MIAVLSQSLLSFSRVVLEIPELTAGDVSAFQLRYPQCVVLGVIGAEGDEDWESVKQAIEGRAEVKVDVLVGGFERYNVGVM